MACSHGSAGLLRGQVLHLPVVKKYFTSHATPGTRGEVQNAITRSLSTHINKALSFVPDEAAFVFDNVVAGKTLV